MKQALLKEDDGRILFTIETDSSSDYSIHFKVYQATGWTSDNSPIDLIPYANGTINWDGSSHLAFGEDGLLCISGKHEWSNHNKVMTALWLFASDNIKKFNHEVAL